MQCKHKFLVKNKMKFRQRPCNFGKIVEGLTFIQMNLEIILEPNPFVCEFEILKWTQCERPGNTPIHMRHRTGLFAINVPDKSICIGLLT